MTGPAALRRGLIAVLLSIGIAAMHGGIGQAMSCTGTPSTLSAAASPTAMTANVRVMAGHSLHHEPANHPLLMAHATGTCISTRSHVFLCVNRP
jgi:hypothetical protein